MSVGGPNWSGQCVCGSFRSVFLCIPCPTTNTSPLPVSVNMSPGATQIACTVSTISHDPFVLAIKALSYL